MSQFTALNVEPVDNEEEDLNNAREAQLEEALKLYQVALKLHSQISQGPEVFAEAVDAYGKLFNHEIFTFSDSLSEYERFERFGDTEHALDHEFDAGVIQASDTSNSLPQILYLAYKNRGLLLMDTFKYRQLSGEVLDPVDVRQVATAALDAFAKALARDESDTELWRRAARVASFLGSNRIARYCLEAALEVDDDPTQGEIEPVTLEEGFAGALLQEHLEVLEDEVALSHPIMAPYQTNTLDERMRQFLDPYPFLQTITVSEETPSVSMVRLDVEISDKSWQAVSSSLLQANTTSLGSCRGVNFSLAIPEEEKINVRANLQVQPTPQDTQPHVYEELAAGPDAGHADYDVGEREPEQNDRLSEDGFKILNNVGRDENIIGDASDKVRNQDLLGNNKDADVVNRKRSMSAFNDGLEEDNIAQKRSKRIRKRDTIGTEGLPIDPLAIFQDRLQYHKEVDALMFNYINTLLVKLGLVELGSIEALHTVVDSNESVQTPKTPRDTLISDFREILEQWTDSHAKSYMKGTAASLLKTATVSPSAGLSSFLDHLKSNYATSVLTTQQLDPADGVPEFMKMVNEGWMPLQDVVFEYFKAIQSRYTSHVWPEDLRLTTLQLLVQCDTILYDRVTEMLENFFPFTKHTLDIIYLVQMLFELHLDLYVQIVDANSDVEEEAVSDERLRIPKWAVLATKLAHYHNETEMTLRYLWSSALFVSHCEDTKNNPNHIISSWQDMKRTMEESGNPVITIANNAAMPELSCAAADRQVSKITSGDFFSRLISSDRTDPIKTIETLEPVLIPESYQSNARNAAESKDHTSGILDKAAESSSISEELQNMWNFLKGGSAALHLFLWQRLREAYQDESIDYKTKIFSCHLKSIEVIVGSLHNPAFLQYPRAKRQSALLGWLKTLDDLLVRSLTMALNDNTAFDIIDEQHTVSTCTALVELCLWLHSAAIFDDRIRIGATIPKIKHGSKAWDLMWRQLREMQVRAWTLLYAVLKDAMVQHKEDFPTIDSDLADYLSVVHVQLGSRKQCKVSNKIFLKWMKLEMIRFKHVEKWSDYMGQVLYDLYGLKLGSGVYVLGEHDCVPEKLEKKHAIQIVDKVVELANMMSIKDLLKSELRATIEAMQKAISVYKTEQSSVLRHNERVVKNYLKGAIRPKDFPNAIKGQLNINVLPVRESSDIKSAERVLGQQKWYFLLGIMALTKFKTQKRLVPGAATDDLRVALTFLQIQVQHTPDYWEAWYRLGQCFDAELEESVIFSADKLNNSEERKDIARYQRQAMRCYLLSYSVAFQHAKASFETTDTLGDMYHDFGLRVYSSSREPFSMEAFYLDDFTRHFCGANGVMYIDHAHPEFNRAQAWQFAAFLFRKAISKKPAFWFNHYMLGKCLWKMFTKDTRSQSRPSLEELLQPFVKAIERCPKTPTSGSKDPILEPHYKYMSIIHKLVLRGEISIQNAADRLQAQHYTYNKGVKVFYESFDAWKGYITDRIRAVQHADKSSWHHRIIFRLARMIHDDQSNDVLTAREAHTCLMKSMFTKTMVVNVWKPEYERLGRHCVYGEIYIRYMVHLLIVLNEREQMLQLCRRVRKRQADYFHFQGLWMTCIEAACTLYRRAAGDLPSHTKEELLNMEPDEFRAVANRLKERVDIDVSILPPNAALYKEIDELKRLNMQGTAPFVKTTLIDDLIIDMYSAIFKTVGLTIAPTSPSMSSKQLTDTIIVDTTPVIEARLPGPMSITSMLATVNSPEPSPPQESNNKFATAGLAAGLIVPSIEKETIVKPAKPLVKRELLQRGQLLLKGIDIPQQSKSVDEKAKTDGSAINQSIDEPVGDSVAETRLDNNAHHRASTASPGLSVGIEDGNADEEMGAQTANKTGQLADNELQDNQERAAMLKMPAEEEQKQMNIDDFEESESGSVHDSADDESDGSDGAEADNDIEVIGVEISAKSTTKREGGFTAMGQGERPQ